MAVVKFTNVEPVQGLKLRLKLLILLCLNQELTDLSDQLIFLSFKINYLFFGPLIDLFFLSSDTEYWMELLEFL